MSHDEGQRIANQIIEMFKFRNLNFAESLSVLTMLAISLAESTGDNADAVMDSYLEHVRRVWKSGGVKLPT